MLQNIELNQKAFDKKWSIWLCENLMSGVKKEKIADIMIKRGFESGFVWRKIEEEELNPAIAAGRRVFLENAKLYSLLEVLGKLFHESEYIRNFKKVEKISREEFYEKYFFTNRPVLISGLMEDWPALKLWSPDYFAEQFGDLEIEISANRNADPFFEDNFQKHRYRITMNRYVEMIKASGETNDLYLVAKNDLLSEEACKILQTQFSAPQGILNQNLKLGNFVRLWFGPSGTLTPLHHDSGNILFGQVYGRKKIRLISPYDIGNVYNNRTCFSAVDLDNIDYVKFPLMHKVEVLEVVVEPGDFLLLPVGWWHWVQSLDISISLSFQNFNYKDSNVIWKHDSNY